MHCTASQRALYDVWVNLHQSAYQNVHAWLQAAASGAHEAQEAALLEQQVQAAEQAGQVCGLDASSTGGAG